MHRCYPTTDLKQTGTNRKFTARIPEEILESLQAISKKRHTTVSKELIRVLTRGLLPDETEPESKLEETELRLSGHLKTITASLEQIKSELEKMSRIQHTQLAISTGLVKTLLTLIPEPADLPGARAKARLRYAKFIEGFYETELEGKKG